MSKFENLGRFIVECDDRNVNNDYGLSALRGVSINKVFIESKANMDGVSLTPYKLVKPNEFCYVTITSRNGEKISLAQNTSTDTYIVSSSYVVFRIKDVSVLLPDYLYLILSRPEFDRYARFNSWGSAREAFTFESLKLTDICVPSLEEQQKVVNAWKALREIKEQNEAKVAPLMQLCQSYIQELKHKSKATYRIGDAIKVLDKLNVKDRSLEVLGLSRDKTYMPTVANMTNVDTSRYKVLTKGTFAFNGMHVGRDVAVPIAKYDCDSDALISPAYTTFEIDKTKGLLEEYFEVVIRNKEFDRLAWFYCDSSVRGGLEWKRFLDIKIPYVPLDVQRAIANIYKCANEAKQIAAEADRLSREVCPALIQHVIHN